MSSFPYYGPADIDALNAQAVTLLKLFKAKGYDRQEPSVLQPAALFLDSSGEEIRRRTFTLTDPSGLDLCLRPDITIPICKRAVDASAVFPARISYNGPVFRYFGKAYDPNKTQLPSQFFQAGVELLGLDDGAAGEEEVLSLAVESLRSCGVKNFEVLFGDLALFNALVEALDVPAQWRERLKRHFWRGSSVDALLRRLGAGAAVVPTRADIEARLDAIVDAPFAGRARYEIVERAMDQAAESTAVRIDPKIATVIHNLFSMGSTPAIRAAREMRILLRDTGVKLDAQMNAIDARLEIISGLGIDLQGVQFTPNFGRNLEYYTGFVFELQALTSKGPQQVAGGGRYDTLMQSLGAKRPVSAVGCAILTERLLDAAHFAQGPA